MSRFQKTCSAAWSSVCAPLVRFWAAHRTRRASGRSTMRWQVALEALAWSSNAYVLTMPYSLGAFTDARLAQAWLESSRALDEATTTGRRLQLVEARASYLEEMEVRCPAGVMAWLATDPVTSPDPLPFLVENPSAGVVADWDLLIP